jgi:hypothetical protein
MASAAAGRARSRVGKAHLTSFGRIELALRRRGYPTEARLNVKYEPQGTPLTANIPVPYRWVLGIGTPGIPSWPEIKGRLKTSGATYYVDTSEQPLGRNCQ